jgi:hypothetical protein
MGLKVSKTAIVVVVVVVARRENLAFLHLLQKRTSHFLETNEVNSFEKIFIFTIPESHCYLMICGEDHDFDTSTFIN